MSKFIAVAPGSSWPSGDYRDVAILPLDDQEVANLFGDLLQGTEPGLGEWLAVGFQLPDHSHVELIRYKDSPPPFGYTVRLDSAASIEPLLSAILHVVDFPKGLLPWIATET